MKRLRFDLSSSQGSQRYLWGLFVIVNILLMIDELQLVGQNLFLLFFLIRLSLLLVAFYSATALHFKKTLSGDFLSLYVLFLISVGAIISLFDSSEMILRLSINAFFYLLLAASFSGEIKDWLQIYLPAASFLLFAPVGLRASYLLHFENIYFVLASLLCSNGIVFVRKYLKIKSPSEIKMAIGDASNESLFNHESANLDHTSQLIIGEDEGSMEQHLKPDIEIYPYQKLLILIREVVGQKQRDFSDLKKTQISAFTPRIGPDGFGIRTEVKDLKPILNQLIDEAVESLGMQTGFVRLHIQFTLRQMFLIVEDNGRGISKDALLKLKARNLQESLLPIDGQEMKLMPLEMRALFKYWGAEFEMASRLGVGRRVCMSFPLVPLIHEEVIVPIESFESYTSNELPMIH